MGEKEGMMLIGIWGGRRDGSFFRALSLVWVGDGL